MTIMIASLYSSSGFQSRVGRAGSTSMSSMPSISGCS
jgi:hypothetical protein